MALRLCQIQYSSMLQYGTRNCTRNYTVLTRRGGTGLWSNFIFNFRQARGECQVEKKALTDEWNSFPGAILGCGLVS